jgi:catechol 2,3-dioxygenase-like lactoylglutathione lyase family enzyme
VSIALNHTIVWCRDPRASAAFLTDLFGLPDAVHWGPFMIVDVANGLSLDYHEVESDVDIASQHYAFLVREDEFDEIFGRILARALEHWADPAKRHPGEINPTDGGRGVYFEDPDGHFLEIITRPYGSGAEATG